MNMKMMLNGMIAVLLLFVASAASIDNIPTVETVDDGGSAVIHPMSEPTTARHSIRRRYHNAVVSYRRRVNRFHLRQWRRAKSLGLDILKPEFNCRVSADKVVDAQIAMVNNAPIISAFKLCLIIGSIVMIWFGGDAFQMLGVVGALKEYKKSPSRKCKLCLDDEGEYRVPVVNNVESQSSVRIWVHRDCAKMNGSIPINERGEPQLVMTGLDYDLCEYQLAGNSKARKVIESAGLNPDAMGGSPTPTPTPKVEPIPTEPSKPTPDEVQAIEEAIQPSATAEGNALWHIIEPSATADLNNRFETLENELRDDLGGIPKPTIIQSADMPEPLDLGLTHSRFDDVLKCITTAIDDLRFQIALLHGPSGTGKSRMAGPIAQALGTIGFDAGGFKECGVDDVTVISCRADMEPMDLVQFQTHNLTTGERVTIDADFTKRYENGGLYFLDEAGIIPSESSMAIAQALAGDSFTLPCGRLVKRHIDFRMLLADNTKLDGRSQTHNTRQKQDGAFVSRIDEFIHVGYDKKIERAVCDDRVIRKALIDARERMATANIQREITTRHFASSFARLASGKYDRNEAIDSCFSHWTKDELARINRVPSNLSEDGSSYEMLGLGLLSALLTGSAASMVFLAVSIGVAYWKYKKEDFPNSRQTVFVAKAESLSEWQQEISLGGDLDKMTLETPSKLGRDLKSTDEVFSAMQQSHEPTMNEMKKMVAKLLPTFEAAGIPSIAPERSKSSKRGRVSITSYLAGNAKIFNRVVRANTEDDGIITLCVQTGGNWHSDADDFKPRAAAAAASILILENLGYRVNLWCGNFSEGAISNPLGSYFSALKIKSSDEPLNMDIVTTGLSAWYFRTAIFASYKLVTEKLGGTYNNSLGRTQPSTQEQWRLITGDNKAVLIDADITSDNRQQIAVDSILSALKSLGVIQADRDSMDDTFGGIE